MNFLILSLLVLLASLLVVSSQQELLAKKAKSKAKAKKSSQYLNAYLYSQDDTDCSGPVGAAYSMNTQGCWYGGDCGRRRLAEKKVDAVAHNTPNKILEKLFHGRLGSAKAKKLQDGHVAYTNSLSMMTLSAPYAPANAQMEMYGQLFHAEYNTSSCDAAGFQGTELTQMEMLPLNTCIDIGVKLMYTVTEGASPPDYGSSDFLAISLFNSGDIGESECSAGVPNDNPDSRSFNVFEYQPIGTCNYLSEKYAHNNATGEVTYQRFETSDCDGEASDPFTFQSTADGCEPGGNGFIFFSDCGWRRTDLRKAPGTSAKKSAQKVAQLRQ